MPRTAQHILLLLVLSAIVLCNNLGTAPLWDEDEPRNAGCAAEMLERGDWVVPWFNGEIRTHKPVLLYWLTMASYSVFGVSEFSARCVSAVMGIGCVLLTYLIGCRLFDARRGVLAAIILVSSITPAMLFRAATPDAVLIFPITLAMAIYAVAVSNRESGPRMAMDYPQDRRVLVAMYGVMGLAVLAKGPIGLVLPTAVIGMFLLIRWLPERPPASTGSRVVSLAVGCLRPFHPLHFLKTCLAMKPVTATLACLAVALPWYVLVTIRSDGEWTRGFFLDHNLGRFAQPMEHHSGPFFYYPLVMCVSFFPWSVFLIPAALHVRQQLQSPDDMHSSRVFCLCWVGVVVGLFTVASTKLPSYVAPCYPALALLTADYLMRLFEQRSDVRLFWPRVSIGTLVTVGFAISIGLYFAARHFVPGTEITALLGLPLIAGGAACWWLMKTHPQYAALTFTCSAIVFTASLLGPVAGRIGQQQQIADMMDAMRSASDSPKLTAAGEFRSTWVFYARRPIEKQLVQTVPQILAADHDQFAIMSRTDLEQVQSQLPDDIEVISEVPFFLKRDKSLVLLGRGRRPRDVIASRPE